MVLGGAKTYEECMVTEMKGQDRSMMAIVHKLCSRKHKKEVYVARSEMDVNWSVDPLPSKIKIAVKSGEYIVQRAKVRFAPVPCAHATAGDWNGFCSVEFQDEVATVFTTAEYILKGMACMETTEAYGIYK
jgi:hypothetical protein